MHKVLLSGLLMLASIATTYAQKYSNEFLSIGAGAKAHGMGGGQTALSNDVSSGYWNPAGLTQIQTDLEFSFMHNEWFGSIGQYDYFGIVGKLQDQPRYLGFTFVRFGVDNIPNTLSLYESDGSVNYNNVTSFNAADYAFMGHFAQRFDSIGLSIGATAKVIHRKIGPFATAWGFGADLGAQYRLKNFKFGLMLRDITTTFNTWSFYFTDADKQTLALTNNDIPIKTVEITLPKIELGVGYSKQYKIAGGKEGKRAHYLGFAAALDFQFTTDGPRRGLFSKDTTSSGAIDLHPMAGLEINYNNMIFLRSGINNLQHYTNIDKLSKWAIQPNFGIGVRIYKVTFDYALSMNGGSALLDNGQGAVLSHIVSLKVALDYSYIKRSIEEES